MTNATLIFRAGVALIPALFFILAACPAATPADGISTSTLHKISRAVWAERRAYDQLPEAERWSVMRDDLAFDAWLAQKARQAGLSLNPLQTAILEDERRLLENDYLHQNLMNSTKITPELIQQFSSRWAESPQADMYEVHHIFLDATHCDSEAEREAVKQRALEIKARLTPENFASLARLWSDTPAGAEGGYLGAVRLSQFGPTFSEQIRQTPPGTIGGPYPTKSGWNIFFVKRKLEAPDHEFTPDQLRDMTLQVVVKPEFDAITKDEVRRSAALKELSPDQSRELAFRLTALEHAFLAQEYINSLVDQETPPSTAQLRKQYDESRDELLRNPRRRASAIFLTADDWTTGSTRAAWLSRRAVRDQARKLYLEIQGGAAFEALARQHSQWPSAARGGDLGWVQEPSSYEIDTTLSKLSPGEVSPPIALAHGYVLLKLHAVEPRRPKSFEEARPIHESRWRARQTARIKAALKTEFARTQPSSP